MGQNDNRLLGITRSTTMGNPQHLHTSRNHIWALKQPFLFKSGVLPTSNENKLHYLCLKDFI